MEIIEMSLFSNFFIKGDDKILDQKIREANSPLRIFCTNTIPSSTAPGDSFPLGNVNGSPERYFSFDLNTITINRLGTYSYDFSVVSGSDVIVSLVIDPGTGPLSLSRNNGYEFGSPPKIIRHSGTFIVNSLGTMISLVNSGGTLCATSPITIAGNTFPAIYLNILRIGD